MAVGFIFDEGRTVPAPGFPNAAIYPENLLNMLLYFGLAMLQALLWRFVAVRAKRQQGSGAVTTSSKPSDARVVSVGSHESASSLPLDRPQSVTRAALAANDASLE